MFRITPASALDASLYRRLAIIGTESLQKTGLTDLVAAELRGADIELVEREQLAALVNEQSLANVFGANDPLRRVQMGQLAKADALVLLREESNGPVRVVRVIVAECHRGARLSDESYAIAPKVSELAQQIALGVMRVRRQFADGIKRIVVVPPFIARNFTYEYHPLQTGYAILLAQALEKMPGVAVLEIAEAQEIQRELESTGGMITAGVVPILLEGEFEVVAAREKQPPHIELTIVIRTMKTSRVIVRHDLTSPQALHFISQDMAGEILPAYRQGVGAPFSADAEFASLAARADLFSSLGESMHAADLRQAALVIHPDDSTQHVKLAAECLATVEFLRKSPAFRAGGSEWDQMAAQGLEHWRAALQSLEWQVHHDHEKSVAFFGFAGDAAIDVGAFRDSLVFDQAQKIKRDFLEHVFPLTLNAQWDADRSPEGLARLYLWVDTLMTAALYTDNNPFDVDDFDSLLKLLNDVVPADLEPNARVMRLLWGVNQRHLRSAPAFLPFLDALRQSPKPLNRIVAEVALLSWQVRRAETGDPTALLIAEHLRADYEAIVRKTGRVLNNGILGELDRIRNVATSKLDKVDAHATTSPLATNSSTTEELPAILNADALQFIRIPLRDDPRNGGTAKAVEHKLLPTDGIARWVPCDKTLDIFWDDHAVHFMREAGILDNTFSTANEGVTFGDVQWDGRNVWIATLQQGLWIADHAGTILAKIGEAEELPPCDRGVKIVAIAPDRILLAGSFGPSCRAFLAMVEKRDGAYRAHVFYKATEAVEKRQAFLDRSDIDLTFIPKSLSLIGSSGADRNLMAVVFRGNSTLGAAMHPLTVNLKTLQVSLADSSISPYPFLGLGDGIMQVTDRWDLVVSRPRGEAFELKPACSLHLPRLNQQKADSWNGPNSESWTVGPDGQVYLAGPVWYRVDPKTMHALRLAKNPFGHAESLHVATSSHLGLIAWGRFDGNLIDLYQVRVNEDALNLIPEQERYYPTP